MDGGRLRWELSTEKISFSVLVHELTHAFFMQRDDVMRPLAAETPGLSMTVLGEGFAYAMGPGMYHDSDGDPLGRNISGDRRRGQGWNDDGNPRERLFGFALRPSFEEAMRRGEQIEDYLPRAKAVFQALHGIHNEWPGPTLWIAGPISKEVRARLSETPFRWSIADFGHHEDGYSKFLRNARPGDLLVIGVAGDLADQDIPNRWTHLAPLDPAEIAGRIGRGRKIETEGVEQGMRVVLLAAPSHRELMKLAATTKLLEL
jgi:hypothetical protein